jgi:hypothetical protein
MLIECEDIFEIVFAQDENEDFEKSKWDHDSDDENEDEDEGRSNKQKKTQFRPLLYQRSSRIYLSVTLCISPSRS